MTDWREFRLRVFIDRPIEDIYEAWLSASQLERWFIAKASFSDAEKKLLDRDKVVGNGARYQWEWAEGTIEKGEILIADGVSSFAFSFGKGCTVAVTLSRMDGRTLLELMQTHTMPDIERKQDFYVSCSQAWTFYLTNLKSVYEGGLDLRERASVGAKLINV